ncbi:MAG TPA: DUF72 domain-containing protein [Polyangiaceae bacterium]
MRVLCGTSGFSYAEWRGTFYPPDLDASDMLAFYSSRLGTVEINNTFYQTPKAELLERWGSAVPSTFRFALKASRRISHVRRLKDASEEVGYFFYAAEALGEKLGPVLFQLPPFAKKDAGVLRDFLASLPSTARAAFEFRNPSWFDDEVYTILSDHGAALCGGDSDEGDRSPPFVPTAKWGYLRLRAPSYDATSLGAWSEKILAQPFDEAHVYLKHEVLGPMYAGWLDAVTSGKPAPELLPPAAAEPDPGPKRTKKPRAKKPKQ